MFMRKTYSPRGTEVLICENPRCTYWHLEALAATAVYEQPKTAKDKAPYLVPPFSEGPQAA